jgi:hypothetical protein
MNAYEKVTARLATHAADRQTRVGGYRIEIGLPFVSVLDDGQACAVYRLRSGSSVTAADRPPRGGRPRGGKI